MEGPSGDGSPQAEVTGISCESANCARHCGLDCSGRRGRREERAIDLGIWYLEGGRCSLECGVKSRDQTVIRYVNTQIVPPQK